MSNHYLHKHKLDGNSVLSRTVISSILIFLLFLSVFPASSFSQTINWTDATNSLSAGVDPIRAVHMTELRNAINNRRVACSAVINPAMPAMAPYGWSSGAITPGEVIRSDHFNEMRTAIREVYDRSPSRTLPIPAGVFADVLYPNTTIVRLEHMTELRAVVEAATCCGDGNCNGPEDLVNCWDDCRCTSDADCDDGLFCNGAETCSLVSGDCENGSVPGDGIACTDDICNETNDTVNSAPNDGNCAFGEYCDSGLGCTPKPCSGGTDGSGAGACTYLATIHGDSGVAGTCSVGGTCSVSCNDGTPTITNNCGQLICYKTWALCSSGNCPTPGGCIPQPLATCDAIVSPAHCTGCSDEGGGAFSSGTVITCPGDPQCSSCANPINCPAGTDSSGLTQCSYPATNHGQTGVSGSCAGLGTCSISCFNGIPTVANNCAVVNVDGQALSDCCGCSEAGVYFRSDGTVDEREGSTIIQIDAATDWIIPNGAAPGTYYIRATLLSSAVRGAPTRVVPGASNEASCILQPNCTVTNGGWIPLTTDRYWFMTRCASPGISTGSIRVEIAPNSSGSPVLDSGVYSFRVEREGSDE